MSKSKRSAGGGLLQVSAEILHDYLAMLIRLSRAAVNVIQTISMSQSRNEVSRLFL